VNLSEVQSSLAGGRGKNKSPEVLKANHEKAKNQLHEK
jgi:hypothetical protein